jgi:DNA-directed RNA polymerase specialized sigma24 family protein
MSKHLVLQQSDFEALLAWLAPSRDQAGEKYEWIRHRLLRYFEGLRCIPAEEHADETMDRVARRLAGGERIQADPIRYCYGVAKNVFLEYRRRRRTRQQALDLFGVLDAAASPSLSCLTSCLNGMRPSARELLEAYYLDPRAGLAAREGVTPNALRLRVFKEKQRLRACMGRCLRQR